VHELKQLVDNCLEKLPVLAQELGVLAHNVPAAGQRKCAGPGMSASILINKQGQNMPDITATPQHATGA
jgi:hypothetical protein